MTTAIRSRCPVNQIGFGRTARRIFWRQVVALLSVWLLGSVAAGADEPKGGPNPGQLPLDEQNQMQISPNDRCPVCGMKVIRYPKFSCAIQMEDQRTYYFCGNGCLLRTWLHPEIFLKTHKQHILRAVVRDYFSGRQVDAQTVFWIAGSNIIGPMGPAIVALQDDHSASIFMKRHGGRRVFRLSELTDELWFSLTGKPAKSK